MDASDVWMCRRAASRRAASSLGWLGLEPALYSWSQAVGRTGCRLLLKNHGGVMKDCFSRQCFAGLCVVLVGMFPLTTIAQQTPSNLVDIRYETLLKDPKRNMATPGQEFGEQINNQNGALSFSVVDVSIPGNSSLPVEFRRELDVTTPVGRLDSSVTALRDWDLGIPRIEASYDSQTGWSSSDPARKTKNCSIASQNYVEPPLPLVDPDYYPLKLTWNPPVLIYPGSSVGGRLLYNKGYLPQPSGMGTQYWLTAGLGYLSCLPTLKNAGGDTAAEQRYTAGEGFLLVKPDGTRIWFDWMSLKSTIPFMITKPYYGTGLGTAISESRLQETYAIYPTRMEDRQGNWVNYSYANKSNEIARLTKIESSDGRIININYTGSLITSVVAGGRSWIYSYNPALSSVTNPDGSTWKYTGASHSKYSRSIPSSAYGTCVDQNVEWDYQNKDWTALELSGQGTFNVKNPAGATANFYIDEVYQGRSNVPKRCFISGYTSFVPGQVISKSDVSSRLGWWGMGVVGKRVTGPGLPDALWRYSYQSVVGFAPAIGATYSKTLDPDGVLVERTYGNQAGKDESLVLSVVVKKNGEVISQERNSYLAAGSVDGFPKLAGFHPNAEYEYPGEIYIRPMIAHQTEVGGQLYEWKCIASGSSCLDQFGRPVKTSSESRPVSP